MAWFSQITNKCGRILRNYYNKQHLKNHGMSVISSNCTGAVMLHDLNQPFNSPFVNLYLTPTDFVRYLQHIDKYQFAPLQFIETKCSYPVAKLLDLTIYFVHYNSQQQAEEKWKQRSKRLDFNNLFVIMSERDGCTYQDLLNFDALPFTHKIVFTHQHYPEIQSAFYIQGFEQQNQVGELIYYCGQFGKRYYDQFDYVGWFNQKT